MQLRPLPTLPQPAVLRDAESASTYLKSRETVAAVTDALENVGRDMLDYDNEHGRDHNPERGQVVLMEQWLGHDAQSVEAQVAELRFDPQSGKVERFVLIEDDANQVRFEYKRYDESVDTNPTFTRVQDGRSTSVTFNPANGVINEFRG